MLRTELVAKLDTLSPALLPNAIVPAMAQVWFRGERAMTYNDTIAISVPLETPFQGAVPGTTLIKVLKTSLAKQVELTATGPALELKAARTRLKLALTDPDSAFIFTMPKVEKYVGLDFDLGRAFVQALDHLMLSVGDDPLQADQCGVTLIQEGENLLLYSTNRSTISCAEIPKLRFLPKETRVILPTAFCQQLVSFKESLTLGLHIGTDHACFYAGKVEVWGRLLESKKPLDFVAVTKASLPEDLTMVPVPHNLGRIVDRILAVSDDKGAAMTMTVENERCSFELSSSRGEIFDSVALPGHPDISARLRPLWVRPVCDFSTMALTERCLVMRAGTASYDASYLVSTGAA